MLLPILIQCLTHLCENIVYKCMLYRINFVSLLCLSQLIICVPKLNGTHQLLAYADDVNILGGSIHTLKENAEALVAATRETTGSKC